MAMLTHRQLRYFVEIVDAGGFSQAAQRLFVAQSALSRQVRDMEDQLQVRLLARDRGHLALTPAGESLYADARRILAALDEAAVRAVHAQRGTEGTLQLLHSSSVPLNDAVQALLRGHVRAHPGVSIEVSLASSENQALDIRDGRADVGLARAPILRRYADLAYVPLWREALVAVLPEGHALAARPAHAGLALRELRDEGFVAVAHPERGGLGHRVGELCRAHGFAPRPAAVRSRKWSQLALVQAGLGVAVVPASMGRLAPAGVAVRPLMDADCVSEVWGLWRREPAPLAARFVDALQAAAAQVRERDAAGAGPVDHAGG